MKKNPLVIIGAALGAVAIIAAVGIIAFKMGAVRDVAPNVVDQGRGTVITEDNVDEIREQIENPEPIEDGYYRTIMTVEWDFPNSSAESPNAVVENADTNTRTVYFDLTLADTNELIYSSPYIPVGETLDKIKLDKEIPAGEYEGIVTYHLVDDEMNEITTTSVGVVIRIAQ
jgi:hypothetical protein